MTSVTLLMDSGAEGAYSGGGNQNVVKAEKSLLTGDDAPTTPTTTPQGDFTWPLIQTYLFSSTIEIQYNKAGGTQISSLTYDDVDSPGLSLDRSTYPVGAQVHVTIEDNRLNIDPTSDDIWAWNTASLNQW